MVEAPVAAVTREMDSLGQPEERADELGADDVDPSSDTSAYVRCVEAVSTAFDDYVEATRALDQLDKREVKTIPGAHSNETIQATLVAERRLREAWRKQLIDERFVPALNALRDALGTAALHEPDETELEAVRQASRVGFGSGAYGVVVAQPDEDADPDLTFLEVRALALGVHPDEASELWLKVREVGPHELVSGLSLPGAVRLKEELMDWHWVARIRETGAWPTNGARPRSR